MSKEINAQIVIVGGSTGGCAAALAAAKMGKTVIMTEETYWIGGQLTSQGVPPDEHPWIERFGCTSSYRKFRNGIRNYYKNHFPLSEKAAQTAYLNPGNGNVSRLCHEPRVALSVINEMLAPYVNSGRVKIMTRYKVESAETLEDNIVSVTVKNIDTYEEYILAAAYFLDATECGDLLPQAKVEYVTGAESVDETGEPHALKGKSDPLDMQAITYCFAMDYLEGEDHTIEKPEDYDFWRNYKADFWPARQLSWITSSPRTLEPSENTLFPVQEKLSLWLYRRIIDKSNFSKGIYDSDVTLVNWPQIDYWLGPVFEVSEEEIKRNLRSAKQLSLSLLYWMQTEAPRPDGKQGYPGLRLRKDVLGTDDGLAMYPYIRESRRIKAEFTILEQHVSPEFRQEQVSERFYDSVGIGSYRIDLHPSTGNRNYIDISSLPFQIPLGSLIPVRVDNLLPACKNIGTTHITNGCYRLHPVEWNIGEACGYLAGYCIDKNIRPREVRNEVQNLEDFQSLLIREGIEIEWPSIHAL
jgi:hypothetical protein